MAEQATIQLPKDLIEAAIEKQVATAVVEAFGNKIGLIQTAIARVMTEKVDCNGQKTNYGSNRSWIQWLMEDCIKSAIRKALTEHIEKQRPIIEKMMVDEMSKKNSPLLKQLAKAFAEGTIAAAQNQYRMVINVEKDG